MTTFSRRNILKTSIMGGVAVAAINSFDAIGSIISQQQISSRVALTTGDKRADLVFRIQTNNNLSSRGAT